MEAQTLQNRAQIGPRGVQDDQKIEKEHRPNKEEASTPQRTLIFSENVANMASTWVPRRSQNGEKIDAKIDQKFDASWDRFLRGFGRILGAKMEPCWQPKETQDGSYLESTEHHKNL